MILLLSVAMVQVSAAGASLPAAATRVSAASAYSTQLVQTDKVDCTVVRPWDGSTPPGNRQYPVIAWANGWDYNNSNTTAGYLPGLIEWALDGPYIVVADNSRSPKVSDLLACLKWVIDQNYVSGSEYEGRLNTAKIGLSGHSQGGGVAILSGNGGSYGFNITAVVAMNPYAPNWNGAELQKGPAMLIGGTDDTVTPVSTYTQPAFDKIVAGGKGGLMTVLQGGDHNTDAWAPSGVDPTTTDFGRYQYITTLWWRKLLNDDPTAGRTLKSILDQAPWTTQYSFTSNFQLP